MAVQGQQPARTLSDLVTSGRRRGFVGRAAEVDLFRAALAQDDPAFRVLFHHGPGGVGKTALLREYAAVADEAGARVVRLEGRAAGAPVLGDNPRPASWAASSPGPRRSSRSGTCAVPHA